MGTRFYEKNCAPQCSWCNGNLDGNDKIFAERLVAMYGESVLDELEQRKNTLVKLHKFEYEEMLEDYKNRLRELAAVRI